MNGTIKKIPPVRITRHPLDDQSFLLRRVQPALSGLMDGSLSTLAPIFAVALATHRPLTAFFTGAATALASRASAWPFPRACPIPATSPDAAARCCAARSPAAEPSPAASLHTLPFLIPGYGAAISAAIAVVASELLVLAWLRHRFFRTSFARSFMAITVGGAIIAALSAALGVAAAS